jgi:osmotically inducible protein OsmC
MKTIYETAVSVTGGRNGKVKSADGILELEVRMPKELGGVDGFSNPEQLFAAGYAACFDSALNLVIKRNKITISGESKVTAKVGLVANSAGGFELIASLEVHIPGLETDKALELVQQAHQVCPYSNATRNNVDVKLSVV